MGLSKRGILLLWAATTADAFTSSPTQQLAPFSNSAVPPSTGTSSSTSLFAFRFFKPRNRVVKDPKTGFYRPAKSLPLSIPASDDPSLWDQTKEGLYRAVDGITGLAETNPFVKQQAANVVTEGYSDVERRVLKDATKSGVNPFRPSPGDRLVREYQQRNRAEGDTDLLRNKSVWKTIKGAFYSTVDLAASAISNDSDDDAASSSGVVEGIKPVVRESIASPPLQKAIAELEFSNNPVKQALARRTLSEFEKQYEEANNSNKERKATAESVKQAIFGVGDAASETIDTLAQLPAKVTTTTLRVSAFLQRLPADVQRSVKAVRSIPARINETTQKVQSSIDETIVSTRQTVEDIAMIPSKAQQSIVATRERVTNTIQAVDEVATKAKILVGLEKPVPKPPKMPPPKPMTTKDIGITVAKGLTTGLLQASLWAGKEAAILSWKGAKFAFNKGVALYQEREAQSQENETRAVATPMPTTVETPRPSKIIIEKNTVNLLPEKTPKKSMTEVKSAVQVRAIEVEAPIVTQSVSEKQAEIDRQVNKALRLAEEALEIATSKEKV